MKTLPNPMQPRRLVAAYKFNQKTFVWKCDQCTKMFFLGVEEAMSEGIPPLTVREFESHLCAFAATATASSGDEDFRKIVLFPPGEKVREERTEQD